MQFIYQQQKMIDVHQTKIYKIHTVPDAEGIKFQMILTTETHDTTYIVLCTWLAHERNSQTRDSFTDSWDFVDQHCS